jgi:hypothetical protein
MVLCHAGFYFFMNTQTGNYRGIPLDKAKAAMAHQIAQAAITFEQRRTGNHVPKSVTVVLIEGRNGGTKESKSG